MAGLLGDVLPFVYSQADRLKRRVGGLLGDPLGTLTQAVNDANDRAGGLLGQTRAAAMEGLNYGPATQRLAGTLADSYNPAGITVWHGSPHKFSRFDSSKIGTGEGAQAYGHGLYLAESPEVAKSYQSALSADRGFSYGGKTGLTRAEVQDMVNAKYGGGYLDGVIRPSGVADSFIDDMVTGTGRAEGAYPRQYKPGSQRAKIYDELRGQIQHADPGHLYKVDLPDSAVARMLDWDKPLSQQPKEVREALTRIAQSDEAVMKAFRELGPNAPANQAYAALTQHAVRMKKYEGMRAGLPEGKAMPSLSYGQDAASRAIRQQGIPGIRYLDGGSRGQGGGTSNFVIFPGEESLLTILERNGMPLPK